MTFGNSILAGEELVRTGIRSPDFVTGVSGWRIGRDGSAEFNDVLVRGVFETGPDGTERIVITDVPAAQIQLETGDVDEDTPPNLTGRVTGAGGTRNLRLTLNSGNFTSENSSRAFLYSESEDGTEEPVIVFSTGDLQIAAAGGTGAPDASNSLPRGLLGLQVGTGNDVARAAGVATDMVLTPDVIGARTYRVQLHSQLSFGTAAAVYALAFTVDGTVTARFNRWSAAETPAGSLTGHVSSSVLWTPAATGTPTLRVANDTGSGGTVTLTAGATNPRTFSIEDIGVL